METETAPLPVGLDDTGGGPGPDPEEPGWVLGGRYRVRDRIGNGGMAEVFRATDVLLGRDVAVKVFRSMGPTDDAAGAARQELELQALARLSHPNLITLFDASISEVPPYLVMELVEGPNLAARIATGPLPEAEVRAIGAQIADALAYVHAHDMVHRDVKPANILLGKDCFTNDDTCRARLSDFGIVRLLGSERMTAADFTLGTASYLAPEQARGGDVNPAADVYSLGLVLIEALTGVRSFDGPPVEAVLARLARDPEIPSDLAAPWPGLLRAMTARDPESRPTPAEVSRALRAGLAPAPVPPVAVPVPALAASASEPTAAIATPWTAPSSEGWSATGPVGPVGTDPADDDLVDEPPRSRRFFLLAGLFALLIVGAASFLAFGSTPAGTHKPPAGPAPTTVHHPARASHASTSAVNVAPVAPNAHSAAPSTSASTQPSTAAPKATHSAAPATSAAPTTSAPAPTTSAPAPTTSAPVTSAAPQTTAAYIAAGSAPAPSPSG